LQNIDLHFLIHFSLSKVDFGLNLSTCGYCFHWANGHGLRYSPHAQDQCLMRVKRGLLPLALFPRQAMGLGHSGLPLLPWALSYFGVK